MGLLSVKRSISHSDVPVSLTGGGFLSWLPADGKPVINDKTALTLSAFYNGCDQISNDIAKLSKAVFQKVDDRNRNKLKDHPLYKLIQHYPNNFMTSFDFWKVVTLLVILKGNAYVRMIRDNAGRLVSLILLENKDVQVYKSEDRLIYKHKGDIIPADEMLHFKGFSFDGLVGVGIITFAAKQLGVDLLAQKFISEVYEDRGIGQGVIETDKAVTSANKKLIEEGFERKMTSGSKFKSAVLDEGFKFKSITITPAEAEFIQQKKISIIDVARWLNIAPHKIKHLDNATFTNIQHQSIEHIEDSILPWCVRFEQELYMKAFTVSEQNAGHYVKFNVKSLLRADLETQAKFYTSMVYAGIQSRDEVRDKEDLNYVPGLDEFLQPVNMQALSIAMKLIEDQKTE
jgi:HK97 family phage portal protein